MNAVYKAFASLSASNKTGQRRITNVASVPQLSPFRYPGGKTWLVPQIRSWLESLDYRPEVFVEPFAGGGIASLIAVMENRAQKAVMCEIDPHVAAVWQTILSDSEWLADRILSFEINRKAVCELLSQDYTDRREIAFQTLVRNRTQRGGIMAPGASLMKKGENEKGIASRWYPETLVKRIRRIAQYSHRIEFICGDGMELTALYRDHRRAAFFVDPPYTAGGKQAGRRLYAFNNIDHERLFGLMAEVCGEFLMTYSETPEVVNMAEKMGFAVFRVPMMNSHHARMSEVLIVK